MTDDPTCREDDFHHKGAGFCMSCNEDLTVFRPRCSQHICDSCAYNYGPVDCGPNVPDCEDSCPDPEAHNVVTLETQGVTRHG